MTNLREQIAFQSKAPPFFIGKMFHTSNWAGND
ncbi:hypothetical protein J2S07_002991 [Robertmurraya andreesenii]|uniref:Uncharacterized protein n=1 Tax=Anoxybacillus andreesenii TaxID=1325932 RepID=A0ABT9V6U6_9BACL|nr:hypothetical protein [Robertmurraya andreesenii]